MPEEQDLAALARAIIDANLYMVLGTADTYGTPWVSPVYYARAGYREFFWISAPDARHSKNIVARREVSIVVFDSSVRIDTGRGVYMTSVAEHVDGDEVTAGIECSPDGHSVTAGGRSPRTMYGRRRDLDSTEPLRSSITPLRPAPTGASR